MSSFDSLKGPAISLLEADINTDDIIPKQFMKSVSQQGLKKGLFYNRRFNGKGEPHADSLFDTAPYEGARIIISGANFGCGSSREHAVWALKDFGIKCIIAPSFADIFYRNGVKNALLLIQLDANLLDNYQQHYPMGCEEMVVDLNSQTISAGQMQTVQFDISADLKRRLLNGIDDIAETLTYAKQITAYEKRHQQPIR